MSLCVESEFHLQKYIQVSHFFLMWFCKIYVCAVLETFFVTSCLTLKDRASSFLWTMFLVVLFSF